MKQFQALKIEFRAQNADPGRVAARPRHARCETLADHIIGHPDNWDRFSSMLSGRCCQISERDNDIRLSRNKIARKCRYVFVSAISPYELEADIASILPAQLFHVAPEQFCEDLRLFRVNAQNANAG